VQDAILEALEARWDNDGIIVEDVALQEIRYGESVTAAYAAAQEAQINVQTETAKLEAAKVSAQQKVVQAQAEADANAILNASLTPAILQQRYLDTLKELAAAGNLVIVPEGFNGLVNVAR
jgi:regulator of protease activity HflC (stomatin/prohibitin superfamily)